MELIQLYPIISITLVVLKSLLQIQILLLKGQGYIFKNIKWKSKFLNYENYFVIAIHCQARVVNKSYLFGFSEIVILIISEFSKTYSEMKNLWLLMKCKRLFSGVRNLLIMKWNHWENLQFRITLYSILEQKGETPLALMTEQGVSVN